MAVQLYRTTTNRGDADVRAPWCVEIQYSLLSAAIQASVSARKCETCTRSNTTVCRQRILIQSKIIPHFFYTPGETLYHTYTALRWCRPMKGLYQAYHPESLIRNVNSRKAHTCGQRGSSVIRGCGLSGFWDRAVVSPAAAVLDSDRHHI